MGMAGQLHQISEEDRARMTIMADRLIEILASRYGVEPQEVVEAVRWVQEHRDFGTKLKAAGWIGLVTLLLSALGVAIWEGAKSLMRGHP
jgi:hypothetical protein